MCIYFPLSSINPFNKPNNSSYLILTIVSFVLIPNSALTSSNYTTFLNVI